MVAGADAQRAARALDEHWYAGLDEDARAASTALVDLDADETACPACGASLPGGPDRPAGALRCPECGLRLG